MKVIGRKPEIKEIERCMRSQKSELLCVYGRRRVGKTYIVEQTIGNQFTFRATGLEKGNTRAQLKAFKERLVAHGDTINTIPKNWFEAFARLEKVLNNNTTAESVFNKKIIFFDEFPWFATPKSDFLLAFEEFWNRCGTQKNDILFIICGSATSWIMKNVIVNTGNLYQRVTSQLFIKPFTLYETELYLNDNEFDWSREQIIECQMIFGGLPYFLSMLNGNESFRQNADRLLFGQRAILRNETSKLLESTLKSNPIYGMLLKELSGHIYGMRRTDCKEKIAAANGTFNRAVDDLKECGYIIDFQREYEKGNPAYLQLIDPFILFHYHFIEKKNVTSYDKFTSNAGAYNNWRGHAFEILCLLHIEQIKKALGISGVETKEFTWNTREAQIDLVIERADRITNLCEIKYTDSPYIVSAGYEKELINKKEVFKTKTKTKNATKITLISAQGTSGTAHMEHISEVLTLDDLFLPI
ncbi:AAA family ATPase [Butyrivibrio hungatei]|uniref:Archaeal ATPase family protein n=1 Tax=Butyrivibrio hungatei TaxID=185008 RepID=A0A1D9P5M9_9FIRM|nr:ATP-binding protein [Butyrivibrio hungatei]AOZ97888.1 archaeal ATPase family protein [Butyrivibrio hungatei]